jgi:endonuclease G
MAAISEDQQRKLIEKAIEHAEKVSNGDDVAFVRELRAEFFAEESKLRGPTRSLAAPSRERGGEAGFHIYTDPRFAKNARELAQRTRNALRILGGTVVTGSEFEDCVAVGNDRQWFCSGTLIADNAVLSAGHCDCEETPTRVFFGNNIDDTGRAVRVAKAVQHPSYHTSKNNDLLVLLLETKVTDVLPRPIASSDLIDVATDARAVGFGTIDPSGFYGYGIKRQTDVPFASNSCQGNVEGKDDQAVYGCDPNLEMIAGKPLLARDTCSGDSGGPLYVVDQQGRWLLAGATSRATKAAINTCGDGGVYVRIDRYLDWVRSVIGADLR